jgi:hypothetical protein
VCAKAAVRLGAVLPLLAASPLCLGAVYKCAKDDVITYSDSPCGPDATVVARKSPTQAAARSLKASQSPAPGQDRANSNQAPTSPPGCVDLDQLDNTRTPPDLYLRVSACIQQDDYRAAVAIFALAGMDSHFDAARVVDKTAGQAGQELIIGTFDGLPADKREKFAKTRIRSIGFPLYYPGYMVLQGVRAFTAKPEDAKLEPAFDGAATWNSLLTSYLNCRDTATAAPLAPPLRN